MSYAQSASEQNGTMNLFIVPRSGNHASAYSASRRHAIGMFTATPSHPPPWKFRVSTWSDVVICAVLPTKLPASSASDLDFSHGVLEAGKLALVAVESPGDRVIVKVDVVFDFCADEIVVRVL